MERIAKTAEGFIYYVSREGVTGEQAKLSDSIASRKGRRALFGLDGWVCSFGVLVLLIETSL
jgi:hypothetical protein